MFPAFEERKPVHTDASDELSVHETKDGTLKHLYET